MVRGLRIKDGQLEMVKNNDAALDIDLTLEGDNWEPVRDDSGKSIRVSVSDGGIKFLAESDHEEGYDGCRWEDVNIDCESETLKELALYPGEPEAYCYIDSTEGEYLPLLRGLLDQHFQCWRVQRVPELPSDLRRRQHRFPLRLF